MASPHPVTSDATVFGSAAIASLGLDLDERGSASIDLSLTFEQALRLQFALGQALAAINAEQQGGWINGTAGNGDHTIAARFRIDTRRRQLTIGVGDAVTQHPGDALPGLGVQTRTALDNLTEGGPVEVVPPPPPPTARTAPRPARKEPAPEPEPEEPRRGKPAERRPAPAKQAAAKPAPRPAPAPPAPTVRLDKNLERGVKAFLEQYPNGFMDPDFVERQRSHPSTAHQRYLESLGGDRGELLLGAGDTETLVHSAIDVVSESRLLSRPELNAMEETLADETAARHYFQALFAVVSDFEPNERAFRAYANAMESLALDYRGVSAASWPIATVLPHLARPEVFAFVDPAPVRSCAARLDFSLNYTSELNWGLYARVMRMCDNVMQRIGALGARDLIDLCTFLRVIEEE